MKKLLLTLIIAINTSLLHGMNPTSPVPYEASDEVWVEELQRTGSQQQSATKLSTITLPQLYYHFAHDLFAPNIALDIFSLQLGSINPAELLNEIQQHYIPVEPFVTNIKTLIHSCGYLLASELYKRSLHHANISLCDIQDFGGSTVLHSVASHNDIETTKLLLDVAGDKAYTLITMQRRDGATALHFATWKGNTDIAKLLLDATGNWVNEYNLVFMQKSDGFTALHEAAWNNNIDIAKLLLNVAGDVACDNAYRLTSAYWLINMQDRNGWTALHWAATSEENTAMANLLLDVVGDKAQELIDIKNHKGQTAFDIAKPKIKEIMQQYMQQS